MYDFNKEIILAKSQINVKLVEAIGKLGQIANIKFSRLESENTDKGNSFNPLITLQH